MKLFATLAAASCLTVAMTANAQKSLRYGDWQVDIQKTAVYIFAPNDSGSQLGTLCSRDETGCVYYLITDDSCEADIKIPVMLNARTGAANLLMTCTTMGSGRALVFSDYDTVKRAIMAGGQLGIAYPLKSGKFKVSRFNTDQYAKAFEAAQRLHQASGGRGTRDVSL